MLICRGLVGRLGASRETASPSHAASQLSSLGYMRRTFTTLGTWSLMLMLWCSSILFARMHRLRFASQAGHSFVMLVLHCSLAE